MTYNPRQNFPQPPDYGATTIDIIKYLQRLYASLGSFQTALGRANDNTSSQLPWVRPEDYGAKGDGVTDDTAAIQAAATAAAKANGAVLYISDKTYIVSNVTGVGGLTIVGSDKHKSVIKHKAGATDHMIETSGDIMIKNVTLDGNKANQTGRYGLIYTGSGSDWVEISGCILTGYVYAAIYIHDSTDISIEGNDFLDGAGHGASAGENSIAIYVAQSIAATHLLVNANRFINSTPVGGNDRTSAGIQLAGTAPNDISAIITNNRFVKMGTSFNPNQLGCIDLYHSAGKTIVSNNVFEDFYYVPIKTSETSNIQVSDNIIGVPAFDFNANSIGISGPWLGTTAVGNIIVSGNIIDNQYGRGISVSGPSAHPTYQVIISDNIINACRDYAIYASYLTGPVIITGNMANCSNVTYGIEANYSTGPIDIYGNSLYGLTTPDVGIFARTGVTGADLTINNNTISSDGTASSLISVYDAASCVCNSNRLIGDDIPVDMQNTNPLTLEGNVSDNLNPYWGTGVATRRSWNNSWDSVPQDIGMTSGPTFDHITLTSPQDITGLSKLDNPVFNSVGVAGAIEKVTDGGMESWASATDLVSWTEYLNGTSTVNRDNVEKHGGTYSCRFDVDSSNSAVYVTQDITLVAGNKYKLTLWYKTAAGKDARFYMWDSGGPNVYLDQETGTFIAGAGVVLPAVTVWTKYELNFTAHVSYTAYTISPQRGNAASSSIYFDDISIVGLDTYGNGVIKFDGTQVVGARVVDSRLADTPNSGDATTDGIIAALQAVVLSHGSGSAT